MNETPATVRMIDGATAPVISNVFVNNACAVCTLQITGTFTAATVLVQGIVNVASNQWVTLAAFNLSDLSLEKDGADKAGIYQVGIEGILRVRMNVTEVSGGDITIAAQFGNTTINQFSKTEASNLIPVTAYDLAVAGGYTGTLEQFETDMGNSASNATAAANSADEAAQTLTDVQTAGTEAVDAVQTKGQEVLASIPEDYTELSGDVGELKTQLNGVTEGKNLIIYDVIPNEYPSATGFPSYTGWDRSDYIPVTPGDTICITNPGHQTNDNFWYNDEKTPTTKFTIPIGNPAEITVPEGAAYVVISNERVNFFGDVYTKITAYATPDDIDNIEKSINDIDEQLNDISEAETENFDTILTSSKYISSNGTLSDYDNDNYKITNYIDITGKSKVFIKANANFAHGLCAFYDSEYHVISVPIVAEAGSTTTRAEDVALDVPNNAVYIVVAGMSNIFEPSAYYITGYKIKTISPEQVDGLPTEINNLHELEQKAFTDNNTNFTVNNNTEIDFETTPKKYISNAGVISDYDNDNYKVSEYINISGKSKVFINANANFAHGLCAFYDSEYHVISVPLIAESGSTTTRAENEELNVPNNAVYIVIAGMSNVFDPSIYYIDGYKLKKWSGLKWAAVGDSLTEINSRTTKHYHDYISEETGISVINMGVSGTGYKRQYENNKAFYQRIANVPIDSDVVTIFGSGNDQTYYGEGLGTATDIFDLSNPENNTLGACINHTIDVLYSVIPTVQLGIIAPCPWQSYNPVNNDNGMAQYTELLRQICYNRSIPFLDMYHESNLRPWDATFRTLAYSKDEGNGVHPDETGHKLMAGRFRVFLDSLLGVTDK